MKRFWITVAQIRQMILCHFGHEPAMRDIEQRPFHRNETGSVGKNTIVLKGSPVVPLLEKHTDTRERISLNSVTDSSEERIRRQFPGFELMF